MIFRLAVGLAIVAAQVSAETNTTGNQLNGWYPCAEYTFSDDGNSTGQLAECAVYMAPLCYPGICASVNSKIEIFVKRLPAVGGDPEKATNVWLVEGGPGRPSPSMGSRMLDLHAKLNGSSNVYTMDHRGTGRSRMLDCVAAQAQTTASPKGRNIDPTEVAACAKSLSFKYTEFAGFSVTSAATDLATLISKYTNGASTIVYGVNYGTMLVERLMHLDPPEVTGYVMDGIVSTPGVATDKFEYFSESEVNYGEPIQDRPWAPRRHAACSL
ncbi:hypothetical protein PF005_g29894 [Phytophthora fragariae]|uniref:AB hydrolase-1 domain-containing protein n=2 Tax=Phytophthora fragariae TaxID=53985 RepID=A0A6A3VBY5_9STRA|nr:hypothetical protein PF005_g29894 [Phytophthora fragariae]